MILFSHPAPTCSVRHTAHALHRAGILGEFWTYLGGRERHVPRRMEAGFFEVDGGAGLFPNATAEVSLDAAGADSDVSIDLAALQLLDQQMRSRLLRETFDGVYAYANGAEETFRAAGRLRLLRVYHLPSGFQHGPAPILSEEASREPDWAITLDEPPDLSRTAAKTHAELEEADLVFVASTFGLQTIEQRGDVPGVIAIAPPGAPSVPESSSGMARCAGRKLRVLYAGHLSQRAGLSYAFRACRELRALVDFTVVAPPPACACTALRRELDQAHWVATESIVDIRQAMAAHDVFLLPAVYDGRTDLLLQALAMGLPVIATDHSAAPDFVDEGREGFIVPIRSIDAIASKLELLWRDLPLQRDMSWLARCRARAHSWHRYEQIVAASVATALAHR